MSYAREYKTDTLAKILNGIEAQNSLLGTKKGVLAVAREASNYSGTPAELARNIAASPALTEQVLKATNNTLHDPVDRVVDVSRAVLLLGYDNVRTLALSLGLLEQVAEPGHQKILGQEMARSLAGCAFARELARLSKCDPERSSVQAVVLSLGMLLIATHAPEALDLIRSRADRERISDETAAREILGRGTKDLAHLGAQHWSIGPEMLSFLDQDPEGQDDCAFAATLGAEIAEAAFLTHSLNSVRIRELSRLISDRHSVSEPRVAEALETAFASFAKLARSMGLPASLGSALKSGSQAAERLNVARLNCEYAIEPSREKDALGRPANHQEALRSVVMELSERGAKGENINSLMRFALDAMIATAGFQRAILFMRASDGRGWKPSAAAGRDASTIKTKLLMPASERLNLLTAALERDVCLTIADSRRPAVQDALPWWFPERLPDAESFMLLPFIVRGRSVGGIYVDRAVPDTLTSPEDLQLLVAVRNNLILALRSR